MKKVQLHFICGKGGVGKSTISRALTDNWRREGLNVLRVTVNEKEAPASGYLNVTPEDSLHEYLLLKLKSEHLYKLVFGNAPMQALLRFMPSLAELTMLGKIWFEAENRNYDRIVVDCPATGHGYGFLTAAKVAAEGVSKGGIADEARAMFSTLQDPERACVHIVTLPEELPVTESIEFAQKFKKTQAIPLGSLFVNVINPPIFHEGDDMELEKWKHEEWGRVALELYLQEQAQREQIARLEKAKLGMPIEIFVRPSA